MSEPLEIASQSLAAILATWLGLTVLSRAPQQRAPRVFGWVTLLLVAWSISILVERTTSDASVGRALNAIEDVAAFLLPAAGLHIVLAFTTDGPYPRWPSAALVAAYAVGAAAGLQQVVDSGHPVALTPPRLELPGIPGEALAWAWIVFRIAVFALAIGLAARAYLRARGDRARSGQTLAALATISLASIGGTLRFLPREVGGPNWVGISLITASLVVAAYAVFGQGIFLSRAAIRNAFRSSLLGGLALAVYVGVLALLEAATEPILHTRLPIVLPLALIASVALLDPVREAVLRWGASAVGQPSEATYRRLARALGVRPLADQPPEVAIQPAIERLARRLRFNRAVVLSGAGAPVALLGDSPDVTVARAMPLVVDGETIGEARIGPRLDGRPYTPLEMALLDDAASYFAASLRVGRLRTDQARGLELLGAEQRELARRGTELHESITAPALLTPLRVYALGPMRVERGGQAIQSWGGAKAGSRQAEAIFAFLFDRGDRGASKDELTEVVWPDVEIERADLAFHRTLVGLRGTLEPGRPPRGASAGIAFHNDRYRLNPIVVGWSDVAEFGRLMGEASAANDPGAAIRLLEEARKLVRGDFLDDCPFYGDSEYVEERRRLLRGRLLDLLVSLGERYEIRGDRVAAAGAYRDAMATSGGDCPPAESGLSRLGVPG